MRAAFLLAFAAVAIAGDVVQLNPDNFDAEIGNTEIDVTLVKFYAPWCGHCKAMAADYESAATKLKADHPNVRLAELDCDKHGDLARKYGVQGYPTLKIFRAGDLTAPEDYSGPRNTDGIVKAVVKAARPVVIKVDSLEALEKAVSTANENGELVVSAVLSAEKDIDAFTKFGNKVARFFTLYLANGDVPSIKINLPGEQASEYTENKITVAKLTSWAEANKFPLYGEINQENFRSYYERGLPLGWIFVDPSASTTEEIAPIVEEVAKEFKGKISFVHLDGTTYGGMAQRLGLEGKAWPSIGIDNDKTKQHFVLKPEGSVPTAESLRAWVSDVLEGAVEATIRSQPEPESQPGDDGVFVLTGNNFKAATVDSGKDVLIEFYAPWCGHCKALAPEYAGLAKATATSPKLLIAKLDATANDVPVPGFDISGYPTLYFLKAHPEGGEPSIVPYTGGRTKNDMLAFIKTTATHEVIVEE